MVLSTVVMPAVMVYEVMTGVGAVIVDWAIPLNIVAAERVLRVKD
jgi:hypothetical protein